METTTLSSKGPLVIPRAVREKAHVSAGSLFEVRFVNGEIRLRVVPSIPMATLAEVAGCLARMGRKRLSEAQTQAIIKLRLKARHAP